MYEIWRRGCVAELKRRAFVTIDRFVESQAGRGGMPDANNATVEISANTLHFAAIVIPQLAALPRSFVSTQHDWWHFLSLHPGLATKHYDQI